MTTETNPSNSPAEVVSTNTKASMPTASAGHFDTPETVPLVLGGQGRDALDTDLFWILIITVLCGTAIGFLVGWGACGLAMR